MLGHFGKDKTLTVVAESFYWPHLPRDVANLVKQCRTFQLAKQKKQNTGLYAPLPVSICPWEDLSMNFIFGLQARFAFRYSGPLF